MVTVRKGPKVSRQRFEELIDAIAHVREQVEAAVAEPDLKEVSMLRTFGPEDRVKARIEISTGRFRKRREAGIDVMGDGSVRAYEGGVGRTELPVAHRDDLYDAIANSLAP